jgi:hypothetical protein
VSSVGAQGVPQQLQKLDQQLQQIQQSLDSLQSAVEEIPPPWSQILPASTRFVLVMNGAAVLDRETGLVWEKSPSTYMFDFFSAQLYCCGQTTGGRYAWRLPTLQELESLAEPSSMWFIGPTLPSGHPFSNVQSSSFYWSATTYPGPAAFYVNFGGLPFPSMPIYYTSVNNQLNVWCVRGGQGVNPMPLQ